MPSRLMPIVAAVLIAGMSLLVGAQTKSAESDDSLRVKAGTKVMLSLDTPLNTATARVDDMAWFTLRNDIKVDGQVAVPRDTPVRGRIISVKPAVVNGRNQRTEIQIQLAEIALAEGDGLVLTAQPLKVQGESAGGTVSAASQSVGNATQGAMLGGMITQSAKGAGIGAVAAVGVGILTEKLKSKGPTSDVDLPKGSVFEAKLQRALDVPNTVLFAKVVPALPSAAPTDSAASADSSSSSPDTVATIQTTPELNDEAAPAVPSFEPLPAEKGAAAADDTAATAASPAVVSVTPATLSVDVNLVQVDALVRDRAGKPMSNLRQDDFRVLEDGVEQRIQFFSRDHLPLAVALVIDRSGSVAPLMGTVQAAAYQALQLLKAGDSVCLFTFAGNVELLEELTSNRQRVANRIGGIHAGGGTAIVDGVSEALRYLDTVAPDRRRAVILISDNIEGNSSATAEQAIAFALESEAVIYSVKVGNGAPGGLFGLPGIPGVSSLPFPGLGSDDPVKKITRETGGEIFDATGGGSIAAALTTAVDRLKLRYTLSYASPNSGAKPGTRGGYHRIQVRLAARFGTPDTDYTVHARSGYYDQPAKSK